MKIKREDKRQDCIQTTCASTRNKMDGQKDKEKKIKMELVKVTEEMMMEQDGKRVGRDSNHWIYLTN